MTNIIPSNIQVPAHLAARIGAPSPLASALSGGLSSGGGYPRISIKGSRFRIVDGDAETVLDSTYIDVIIVGANPRLSKTWYAKQWTPDSEPQAPDCFSLDGVKPDPDSTDPQSDLCASCPHNAWGSKVTPLGQRVKACADQKRLAVVSAEDPSGPVYLLQVTPAALKNLNQYQKELTMRGIPPEIVKTRVSFDTDASFPKLTFSFAGFIDAETQAVVDQLFGSDQVKEVTGELVHQTVEPLAIEKPAPVKPKPALKAVETVESKAAPAPAPAVAPAQTAPKRGFGSSKPKTETADAASSLADEIAALVSEVGADDA